MVIWDRSELLEAVSQHGTFIYGVGGHGVVMEDALRHPECISAMVAFIDDYKEGPRVFKPEEIPAGSRVVVAIGDNMVRQKVAERLQDSGKNFVFRVVDHPTAHFSLRAFRTIGSMFCAGSIVIAEAHIGKFCIINTGATIDHHCVLGDYVHIAPGVNLCGTVTVGDRTLVGAGSVVRPEITIGNDTVIGVGSVVVNDIPSHVIAYGNPCRIVKEIE